MTAKHIIEQTADVDSEIHKATAIIAEKQTQARALREEASTVESQARELEAMIKTLKQGWGIGSIIEVPNGNGKPPLRLKIFKYQGGYFWGNVAKKDGSFGDREGRVWGWDNSKVTVIEP